MMFKNGQLAIMVTIVTVLPHAEAGAQPEPGELTAFVTVVGGDGAARGDADRPAPINAEGFSLEQNRIAPGEGLYTEAEGSAVLVVPYFSAAVYLGGSTTLRLEEPAQSNTGVPLLLKVVTGRAWVVRKPGNQNWLLIAAGDSQDAGVSGYLLSKGASLFVETGEEGGLFAVRRGEALYFPGPLPEGALIDASGRLVDQTGVALSEGERISARTPTRPTVDQDAGNLVAHAWHDDIRAFALARSTHWLQDAERGDFTPVRGAARGSPEPLAVELGPTLVFDQPRPAFAAPAPRVAPTAVRTTLSPTQALIESGVPGTVVAGQRFRRSRIIGSPGTAGTGALIVNPAAELPFTLGRR